MSFNRQHCLVLVVHKIQCLLANGILDAMKDGGVNSRGAGGRFLPSSGNSWSPEASVLPVLTHPAELDHGPLDP